MVMRWTGREVRALRDALRMSVRAFAAHTNISTASIADMEAKADQAQLRNSTQRILDQALAAAPEEARQRFRAALRLPVHGVHRDQNRVSGSVIQPWAVPSDPPIRTSDHASGTMDRMRRQISIEASALPGDQSDPVWHDGRVLAVDEEISMAAEESARFMECAEQTNVGPSTLDQFLADITRIANVYPNRPVHPSFVELRSLRNRAFEKIEGRQFPNQTRDLYLITGWLCGLLANASFDLGRLDAAQTHARTAFLCAELAGSNTLRAWVRGTQALVAYWQDRPQVTVQLAQSGHDYTPEAGTAMVRLAAIEARAWGRLHDAAAVDAAIGRATQARHSVVGADEPGGMLEFPEAKQSFYAATANLWLGSKSSTARAENDANQAVVAYLAAAPYQRRLGELSLARLDRATARLARGHLEGAAEDVRAVLAVCIHRPTLSITRRLNQVRVALEQSGAGSSALAAEVRAEITDVTDRTAVSALPHRGTP